MSRPALVRTLYGVNNPSGRLTASFPRSVGQLPLYYNQLNTGRPLPPGFDPSATGPTAKYRSRYIDLLRKTPLEDVGSDTHASAAPFIDGAATARSKKPIEVR